MVKNLAIIAVMAVVIGLPFALRQPPPVGDWRPGDPQLIIVTPHNEAIRYEFGQAFSRWHQQRHGRPVKIDWRNIGGATEISRYLAAAYTSAVKAWWQGQGRTWPEGMSDLLTDGRFDARHPPRVERREGESDADLATRQARATALWQAQVEVYQAFRATDDPAAFTSKIDLFFGGGEIDHRMAFQNGLTVAPWPPGQTPAGLFELPDGTVLIPEAQSGETWRTPTLFGNAISTFGIVYNKDRLRDLGVARPPAQWRDLADPVYVRQVGLSDPTKSGSIAKAYEMLIHQTIHDTVRSAGYDQAQVAAYEAAIGAYRRQVQADFVAGRVPRDYQPGELPPEVPAAYQAAVERGWADGLRIVQQIGANARYFTDSASKVPVDVSMGDAAVGMAIDFYGRYQAQCSLDPDTAKPMAERERMVYITPVGGSSVSCDPISLLRGSEHRELAVRFIAFTLSEEGQRLWTYQPGTPGGPEKFALRRLPIRRDFYPSTQPAVQAVHERHRPHAADDLANPTIDPYVLAGQFTYWPRWTASHFGVQRELVKAMCLDSGDELRAAWEAIIAHGGPARCPEAMAKLGELPVTWAEALRLSKRPRDELQRKQAWTASFRAQYRAAEHLARQGSRANP